MRGAFCAPVDDVDRDGAPATVDCDDRDATRSPDILEDPCNGVDDDCDGSIDEIDEPTYLDQDGDGFGDANAPAQCGEVGVPDASDCDDGDGEVFPGAPDTCGDGLDQDCDGEDACDAPAQLGCLGMGGTFAMILPPVFFLRHRRTPSPR